MENTPRKASDLLLELETKIDTILNTVKSQDLNIKILSNKLNAILELIKQQPQSAPKFGVEAVHTELPVATMFNDDEFTERNVPVSAENKLPLETAPKGFRRTSRPETYAGDNEYLPAKAPPREDKPAEIIVPQNKAPQNYRTPAEIAPEPKPENKQSVGGVPVQQRTVDKNGKSIFLADIEIFNANTGELTYKTRTNGAGKWFAALPVGIYKVTLRKKESLSKDKLEATQEVKVDGAVSPLELPMIIVK